jgi:hypothetical protein
VLVCLAQGCTSRPSAADAGHVDFDLAHGLPVMPAARVVYGGALDDVFSLELATARPVADVVGWYRDALPKVGWRDVAAAPPRAGGAVRLSARRGGSWLHARVRTDGAETEVSFAIGSGPPPAAEAVLPNEAPASASAPVAASAPGSPPAGPAAEAGPADALSRLPLPPAVRRVGVPTVGRGVATVMVSSTLDVRAALTAIRAGWDAAGWRTDAPSGEDAAHARRLHAVKGELAVAVTLLAAERGASGTLVLGPAQSVDLLFVGARPAGRRGR